MKDIMEWSTGDVKASTDETLFFLPSLQINCAVKTASLGKKARKAADARLFRKEP
jgi:hypothetical protein